MVLLVVHVFFAVALFVVGLSHLALSETAARRTDTAELRRGLRPVGLLATASPIVAGLAVLTGLILTWTHGSFDRGWIVASLVLVVALGVNAPVVQDAAQRRFDAALAEVPAGPVPPALRMLQQSVPLRVGQRMVPCLHLAIFFLMIERPAVPGSVATCLVVAVVAAALVVVQRRLIQSWSARPVPAGGHR